MKSAALKTEDTPHVIPIGLDAYRQWAQWPVQRIGARAYMRSTYDRTGGNEAADGSHFLYMGEKENENITLDVQGKGILYFVRTNHWHGSPWHYMVDGNDYEVKETGTQDPQHAAKKFDSTSFIPEKPFPSPLAYTWSTTKGADLNWVPVSFQKSFRMRYGRTHYGTGYYIYKKYANDQYLSHPIRSWNIHDAPDDSVLQLLRKAGTDIAPKNIKEKTGSVVLDKPHKNVFTINEAPSVVRAFKITVPLNDVAKLENVRLQLSWDGAAHPSVNAPLSLFFGAGTLYNREKKKYLVKGFPMNIRYDYKKKRVVLSCYYPMPFFKSARFALSGIHPGGTKIKYEVRYAPYKVSPDQSSYFHATYRNHRTPRRGKDLVLLDTKGTEEHQKWSGSFVGTSIIFSQDAFLRTLEGDPRFFFDNSKSPQAYGTGTEEWCGGGDYWGGENMTLPLAGHPTGAADKKSARNSRDLIESCYRFLLADLMPFGQRAEIHLEHGGWNLSQEHYQTVTYWYGLPSPSLIKTDELDIGKKTSERAHNYNSPQASRVQEIISRYERGIDTFPAKDPWGLKPDQRKSYQRYAGSTVYPAHREDGRITRGKSEFTVHLAPDNRGAMLRRTLDYSFPNQKAAVYIAYAHSKVRAAKPDWKYVGDWYLAGSNATVFSNPKAERGSREYKMEVSNRRFRDDEFLLPAKWTRGHSSVKVRIRFIPSDHLLYPVHAFPKKSAWSELKYQVYSYITPQWPIQL